MSEHNKAYHISEEVIYYGLFIYALSASFSIALSQTGIGIACLGGLVCLIIGIKRNGIYFKHWHIWYYILVAYLIIQIFVNLVSKSPYHSLDAVRRQEWIIVLLPLILAAPLTKKREENLLKVLFISGAVLGLVGIVQTYTGSRLFHPDELWQRGFLYRNEGNFRGILTYAGWQVPVSIVIFTYAFMLPSSSFQRIAVVTGLCTLFGGYLNLSRSMWIGLFVSYPILLIYLPRVRSRVFLHTIIVLLFWVILFHPETYVTPDMRLSLNSDEERDIANADEVNRKALFEAAKAIFVKHPVLGIGRDNFLEYGQKYYPYFTERAKETGSHPHNDIVNMFVSGGILGGLSWLILWGSCIYYLIRNLRIGDERNPIMILGALLMLVCFLAGGLFQCYYTDLENGMIWWFFVGMAFRKIRDREKDKVLE